MKFTSLIRAAAPYARPVLASVAIGWGLGVLADTAKQRQAELQELQAAITEGTGVLHGIQTDIASGRAVLDQLERTVMQLEERADTASRIVEQMQQRAAGLHNGAGPAVAQAFKERADEGTEDQPAPSVAAGRARLVVEEHATGKVAVNLDNPWQCIACNAPIGPDVPDQHAADCINRPRQVDPQ